MFEAKLGEHRAAWSRSEGQKGDTIDHSIPIAPCFDAGHMKLYPVYDALPLRR